MVDLCNGSVELSLSVNRARKDRATQNVIGVPRSLSVVVLSVLHIVMLINDDDIMYTLNARLSVFVCIYILVMFWRRYTASLIRHLEISYSYIKFPRSVTYRSNTARAWEAWRVRGAWPEHECIQGWVFRNQAPSSTAASCTPSDPQSRKVCPLCFAYISYQVYMTIFEAAVVVMIPRPRPPVHNVTVSVHSLDGCVLFAGAP